MENRASSEKRASSEGPAEGGRLEVQTEEGEEEPRPVLLPGISSRSFLDDKTRQVYQRDSPTHSMSTSKRRHTWQVQEKGKFHNIQLETSLLGHRELTVDGQSLYEGRVSFSKFSFGPFKLPGESEASSHDFKIEQTSWAGNEYILLIDGEKFDTLPPVAGRTPSARYSHMRLQGSDNIVARLDTDSSPCMTAMPRRKSNPDISQGMPGGVASGFPLIPKRRRSNPDISNPNF